MANFAAHAWAVAAYFCAAIAGARALKFAYDAPPVFPFCLVADATRWLFGLSISDQYNWRPRDFIAFGVFGAIVACVMAATQSLEFLSAIDWRKLGYVQGVLHGVIGGVTGSTLIILHCGVALLFKNKGALS